MSRVRIRGLDQFQRNLRKLQEKAEKIGGTRIVPIDELLTPTFVSRFTDFNNFQELVDASGFQVNSQEDFDSIPDEEWDAYIAKNSLFSSWEDMLNTAFAEQVKQQLGFEE